MSDLAVAPEGFWIKSHFYRSGHMLHVVTYSCIAGEPEIFRASVDLRPIIAKVTALHNKMHGTKVSGEEVDAEISGFFSSIAKPFKSVASAVTHPGRTIKSAARIVSRPGKSISDVAKSAARIASKVGKSKLVGQVTGAVKGVVQSKITGAALGGLAIAFPPVGAPAVAAYAAANTALKAIEMASAAKKTAQQIVSAATPPAKKAQLKASLSTWAGAQLKAAVASKTNVPALRSPIAQAMKLAMDRANKAKATLARVASMAKSGNVEAAKVARIVTLAAGARKQLGAVRSANSKSLPRLKSKAPATLNGFPALLVDRQGKIIPGRYVEKSGAPRGVLLRQGKVLRGNFARVSGEDLDLVSGVELIGGVDFSGELSDVIGRGHDHHGGESNPFLNKPAHLR